jgi:starch-binding outer membrane protein, SusD/RagB family
MKKLNNKRVKMKKSYLLYILIIVLTAQACKKSYLDRQPLSNLAPTTYFRNANELMLFTNSFYDAMVPSAQSLGYGEFDDNAASTSTSGEVQGNRTVPTTGGGWDWGTLRSINYYLDNSYKCEDVAARKKYDGVARFFRAWFYLTKVQRFGDVPWYSHVIEANDEASLTKPRDSRVLVMDSVLADIDYAIANLDAKPSIDKVTKWTALALKSRICLFEGTFRKYHTEFNLANADKFLTEAAASAQALMEQGPYRIYTSTPAKAYLELFSAHTANTTEVLLARAFSTPLNITHDLNRYTNSASFGQPGVLKTVVNSYLMKDGSRFTDIPGYDTLQFYAETQNRDPRLAQTIRTPGYTRIGDTKKLVPDFAASLTGYQYIKSVTEAAFDGINLSNNDLPVFRFAEALLNFAEAKAELGTLTQADLDKSIKLIRDRVGMPNINLAAANATPDPYLASQYTNVTGANKGVILEIRRERRIELIRENFRYNDIMRWKEGHLFSIPFLGMYFPSIGSFDLDKDGVIDVVIYEGTKPTAVGPQYLKLGTNIFLSNGKSGYVITNPTLTKKFDETKDYLYPLPVQQLLLNPNLKQNPGWQ